MSGIETSIREQLFALQDPEYRAFQCKLMPTVDPEAVIGVRMPALRALAKKLAKQPETADFLQTLPHRYYEENNLHAVLIAGMRDYPAVIAALDAFLPYVDNWATCDMLRPGVFKRHLPELLNAIRRWMQSEHPYIIRFGMEMLMTFYLDEAFDPDYPALVASVQHEDYYVRMMIAWYFATALAKQYDAVLPYLIEQRLELWTHNKTIQKAVESYRIAPEQKIFLKTLRRKRGDER